MWGLSLTALLYLWIRTTRPLNKEPAVTSKLITWFVFLLFFFQVDYLISFSFVFFNGANDNINPWDQNATTVISYMPQNKGHLCHPKNMQIFSMATWCESAKSQVHVTDTLVISKSIESQFTRLTDFIKSGGAVGDITVSLNFRCGRIYVSTPIQYFLLSLSCSYKCGSK